MIIGRVAAAGPSRSAPTADRPWHAEIDRLRVGGMAAVFVVHVGLVFVPWAPWHIQSHARSDALGQLVLALAPWVMPLFMVLAGESAYFSLEKRGRHAYVAERLRHLLAPLCVGILLLVPPQVYLERRLSGAFSGTLLEFYPTFFDGLYPRGNFAWHHLWFLGYLFVFSLAALPVFRRLARPRGRRWIARLAARAGRPAGMLAIALPLVASRVLLSEGIALFGGTPADWHNRTLLPGAFLAGYVLAADERFSRAAAAQWRLQLVVAGSLTLGFVAYAAMGDPVARLPAAGTFRSALFWGAYALTGCCWVLALLGIAGRNPDGGNVLPRLSELVLPFYLLHQPMIVLVAFVVVQREWSIVPSVAAIVGAAFPLSLLSAYVVETATGRRPSAVVLGRGWPRVR